MELKNGQKCKRGEISPSKEDKKACFTVFKRLMKREEGQSLVEFALTAPILLLLMAGIVNFGFIFYTYLNMTITTQESARLASLGKSDCQVGDYINQNLNVMGEDKLVLPSCSTYNTTSTSKSLVATVNPIGSSRKSGDTVTVTLTYSISNLTPILNQFLKPVTLTTKTSILVE
ncbi:TadE/TadG family type IV pilus assembly protein [Pullulanibacillus sp. KACC 23026]|uniref:TadE/TadG family type IV pilus assembly protein n=1 Tax=Pullulanibacillus sp. KACC 23026 TaxID=3028315 RepID=UPI0023B17B74|nr:TadE/TadG family type IV pilus assembly protein [Pullulanibacillus sp. KACC 23026]WEG13579.1 TadE/TadG family type IV pilus assembly protein [Pullulanibacillus sp. KACC 23026]